MRTSSNDVSHWISLFIHLSAYIIALTLAGVGFMVRKQRENAGGNWPVIEGCVQSSTVRAGKGRGHFKYAVLTYSYFMDQYESGEYVRAFLREQSAWEFADAFKDKRVPVHYNPGKPCISTLRREELERLLPPKFDNALVR